MEIIVRATVIYFFLWLVARGTGKRELSEMTAFELILLVTMGDLIQQGVTQEDMSITGALLSVGTLAFWIIVFSAVSWRFKGARPILEGLPVVVLRKGEPLMNVLEIERISLDELKEGPATRASSTWPGSRSRCWSRTGSSRSCAPRTWGASSTRPPTSTRPDRPDRPVNP